MQGYLTGYLSTL